VLVSFEVAIFITNNDFYFGRAVARFESQGCTEHNKNKLFLIIK
jgi:hypothetical protein